MNKRKMVQIPLLSSLLSSDPTGTMRAEKRDGGDPESGKKRHIVRGVSGHKSKGGEAEQVDVKRRSSTGTE